MNNSYIRELTEVMYHIEVSRNNGKTINKYEEVIQSLLQTFYRHKERQSRLFFLGNGGSAAIASHMTADFMKNGGMNTCSLYDYAVMTCMGNDYGYEYIFSKPLEFLLKEGDLVVAISSSGNSQNIINAIMVAKEKKAEVMTFTGFRPHNRARQLADISLYVPCGKYGMVESIHNLILQQIVDMIMERDGVKF